MLKVRVRQSRRSVDLRAQSRSTGARLLTHRGAWLLAASLLLLGAARVEARPDDGVSDAHLPPPVVRKVPGPGRRAVPPPADRAPAPRPLPRGRVAPPRPVPGGRAVPSLPLQPPLSSPVASLGGVSSAGVSPSTETPPPRPEGLARSGRSDFPEAGPPRRPDKPAPSQGDPAANLASGSGDTLFEVDDRDGLLEPFEEREDAVAYVMMGNPRLLQAPTVDKDGKTVPGLEVKGNLFVIWVRKSALPGLGGLMGGDAGGTGEDGTTAPAAAPGGRRSTSIVPEDVREIYAEGAVELTYGNDMRYEADRLYLDPHRFVGLMVAPKLEGHVTAGRFGSQRIPLYVRAERARLIGRGQTVFENAQVSTSRADDRIELKVVELTVEEIEEGGIDPNEPELLGYRRSSTQQYTARSITVRGERVPLFWWPELAFGFSTSTEDPVPSIVRGIDVGRRDHLGEFALVRLGGELGGPSGMPVDWEAEVGGYRKRGPAAGLELTWDQLAGDARPRSRGKAGFFGVLEQRRADRTGFESGEDLRYRALFESRTKLTDAYSFDLEFADFSDRGFNIEYFERDELEHKDRESYARLYWKPRRPGVLVGTLTGKWHQRDFVTETTRAPEAGLWVLGAPLFTPTHRGGLSLDISSHSSAGYLERRFDKALFASDYAAFRVRSDSRFNASLNIGDVRFTGYVGGIVDAYQGRTDGAPDLTRTAVLAGARSNVQYWRTYAADGGPLELDGLRHVIDIDLEAFGRFLDSHDRDEVPFFDRLDGEEERGTLALRLRNRLQTKNKDGGLRNVIDLETSLLRYISDRGPYGRRTAGAFELKLDAIWNSWLDTQAEWTVDLDGGTQTGSVGMGVRHGEGVGAFNAFGGVNYVRDLSFNSSMEIGWRFSPKYAVRAQAVYDWLNDTDVYRVVFRRYSPDHIIEFGIRVRDGDVGIEADFQPAIGGVARNRSSLLNDEPVLQNLSTTTRGDVGPFGR